MTDIRVKQAAVEVLAAGDAGGVRITQASALAVASFPAGAINLSQFQGLVVAGNASENALRVTQAQVLVLVKFAIDNKKIRVWTFSLDGHDFYIIRLGTRETLVYDMTTDTWSEWNGLNQAYWRAHVGTNWFGIASSTLLIGYNTNVIAGDDTYGVLYILDATRGYDMHPQTEEEQAFPRAVTGGVPQRLRETTPCNGVYVTMSLGAPSLGADITLETSDNAGKTWTNHGTITVETVNYDQEIAWRSLGYIRAPGRAFRLTDNGASVRIASMDIR